MVKYIVFVMLLFCNFAFAVEVVDFEGRTVVLKDKPTKIVSLAPIATRIVVQLGLEGKIVGLDSKSLNADILPMPLSQKDLNIVDLGNANIPNEEALLALKPDLIITQYDKDNADKLSKKLGVPVLAIQNRPKTDYELYEVLSEALYAEVRGAEIIAHIKSTISSIESTVAKAGNNAKPKVFIATDSTLSKTYPNDPSMNICGGENIATSITQTNYWGGADVDAEFVIRAKPDIILMWLRYDAPESIKKAEETLSKKEFRNIPAIKNKQVFGVLSSNAGKDYLYSMITMSNMLHYFYPDLYNADSLKKDVERHLKMFYGTTYNDYIKLEEMIKLNYGK